MGARAGAARSAGRGPGQVPGALRGGARWKSRSIRTGSGPQAGLDEGARKRLSRESFSALEPRHDLIASKRTGGAAMGGGRHGRGRGRWSGPLSRSGGAARTGRAGQGGARARGGPLSASGAARSSSDRRPSRLSRRVPALVPLELPDPGLTASSVRAHHGHLVAMGSDGSRQGRDGQLGWMPSSRRPREGPDPPLLEPPCSPSARARAAARASGSGGPWGARPGPGGNAAGTVVEPRRSFAQPSGPSAFPLPESGHT
jgi:hypothetical protein